MRLIKCEFMKTRRRYIWLTALIITAFGLCLALYGNYTDDIIKHGWRMFLYQFPSVNTIFLPILAIVVASRLCDIEHKGTMLKQLCCITKKGKLYDAKLIYGLAIMVFCVLIMWTVSIIFGKFKGFFGEVPIDLYLLYLLFTIVTTITIYIFQHALSLIFKNQAIAFFAGVIGEFLGIFSIFLPYSWLRKSLIWGHYGAMQFVQLFGWDKETRYKYVHFDVMEIDWTFFIIMIAISLVMYIVGKFIFCKMEVR